MKVLKADVSDEAFEGWTRWVDRHGVTVTSLLEAIGLNLATDEVWARPFDEMLPQIQSTIERAREIQAKRRRRS